MTGWDGGMASPTQWTWGQPHVSSGSWWLQESLAHCSPWGCIKLGTTERLSWAELSTCVLRAGVRKAAATEQGPCGISLLCFTLQSTQSCMKIHYKACLSEGKSELSVTSRGFSSLSPHLIWATWEANFGGHCPFNRHPSKASSDNHFQFSSARSHYSSFLKILFLLFQVEI